MIHENLFVKKGDALNEERTFKKKNIDTNFR